MPENLFTRAIEALGPAVVRVVMIQRPAPNQLLVTGQVGTGFILTDDGYIATAGHTLHSLPKGQPLAVILPAGQLIPCRLVGTNIEWRMDERAKMTTDLGVLKTEGEHPPLPWVKIGDPMIAEQGDDVGILGYHSLEDPRQLGVVNLPPQEAQEFLLSVHKQTFAMRATVGSRFEISHGGRQSSFLYLDRHVSIGMSGAPVIWLESGEVIGVVSGAKLEAHMSGIAQVILPAAMTKVYGIQLLQEVVGNLRAQAPPNTPAEPPAEA